MRSWRRTFLFHPEWDELFARTDFFCLQQNIAADEAWFGQIDKESQSSLDWISFRRQIGTIEGVTHFQPQCVARAKTARLNSKWFALFERSIPKLHCIGCAKENLNAVLAGVTGTRNGNRRLLELKIDNRISRGKIGILTKQRVKQLRDPRTLDRDSAKIRAAIFKATSSLVLEMILQPDKILFGASRVHDEQKLLFADAIDDQIVNDSAVLVQQKRVLPGSNI